MEYVVFALALGAFFLVIFIMEAIRARKQKKAFLQYLYNDYEKIIEKDYPLERFEKMGSFFKRHKKIGQLDDITWNDLGMDEIFKRMNYTLSASGEEYLYYTLRTLHQEDASMEHLEEMIQFFGSHPDERVQVQLHASRLGYMGKYSLYDYLDNLDLLGTRSNKKHILLDLLFLPFIGLLWVKFQVGIMGIVLLTIYNILTYFKEKSEIDPYITSFSYIMRLMHECGELVNIPIPVCKEEWGKIQAARKQLLAMRQNSYWVMSPQRGNASGDVLAVLMDYIRMIFHVDLIKFNSMLMVLKGHREDVDTLIQVTGSLETAISIWAFRKSLENKEDTSGGMEREELPQGQKRGWCIPEFICHKDKPGFAFSVEIEEGFHPLLASPVKNSISTHKGVLLTGSNASGKSTFLKTVAINAILAQTIHTCTADGYKAPYFHVYSSMALRDDIGSGESYYIVEIKALKRILDAAFAGTGPILCFVDEVLRGTNTIERIAASTQILKSLSDSNILCFAATHDIELTELLKDDFENYHFEEDVREGDVFFNYKLQSGKATTRNAIKLLSLMGYRQEIIEKAAAQAEHFAATGVWT